MHKKQFIETGRRFINTWECDENAHLNVQFYFAHFEEAEAHFWLESGLSRASSMQPVTRHVRYHRELLSADMTRIESALTQMPDGKPAVLSLMRRTGDDALCASCLSTLGGSASPRLEQDSGFALLPEEVAPRSISAAAAQRFPRDRLETAGFTPTYRSIVLPAHCDGEGNMTAQFHIARVTDAAGHLWDHAGLTKAWLDEHNLGRVAVEMKLTSHSSFRIGDAILLLSALIARGRKTISFRHDLIQVKTGTTCSSVEMTAVCIDKDSRRSIGWPEDKAAKLDQRIVSLSQD